MKTRLPIYIILPFLVWACTTPQTGSDPIVVNAEKTLRISKDTLDLFVTLEYQNQALIKTKFPPVHAFAESVRKDAPQLLKAANDAKNAYKNKQGTSAQLFAALTAVTTLASKAQQYLAIVNTP
jgi:hypothetical protein